MHDDIVKLLKAYWLETARHYGHPDEMPPNVVAALQRLEQSPSVGPQQVDRLRAKMQVMVLSAWAQGKIDGPVSVESLTKKIKAAESLVEMLENKDQLEAAKTQKRRIQVLEKQRQALIKALTPG